MPTKDTTLYCARGDHRPERLRLKRSHSGHSLPRIVVDNEGRNVGAYAYGIDRGEYYFDANPELLAFCEQHNKVCTWMRRGEIVTTIPEPSLDEAARKRCYDRLCEVLNEFGIVAPLIAFGQIIQFGAIQEYESRGDVPGIESDIMDVAARWQERARKAAGVPPEDEFSLL